MSHDQSHDDHEKSLNTTFPPVSGRPLAGHESAAVLGEGQTIGRTKVEEAAAAHVADFDAIAARGASGVSAVSVTSTGAAPARVAAEAAMPDVPVTIQAQPAPAPPAAPPAAPAAHPDNLPTQEAVPLDHYLLLELIGHGGMGDVYQARDTRDDSIVAIKRMQKRFAEEDRYRRQFVKEARHMQAMQHPHILPVKDVMENGPRPYYVMPYLGGGSLTTLRKRHAGGILPPQLAPQVLLPIAEALQYAHDKRGVIHRDIKPENVLFDDAGKPYICDFGLVRTVFNDTIVPDQPQMSWTVGTLAYMAPEVVAGNAGDVRVDVYSFGAMMYELLTGRRPYPGGDVADLLNQIRKSPPTPPRKINPALPPQWGLVIDGAMARQLSARYAHMGDVKFDLERLARGEDPLGPRQDPTHAATQRASEVGATNQPQLVAAGPALRRSRAPLVAAVMVLAIAAGAGIWAWAEGVFSPKPQDQGLANNDDAGKKTSPDGGQPDKPDGKNPAPVPGPGPAPGPVIIPGPVNPPPIKIDLPPTPAPVPTPVNPQPGPQPTAQPPAPVPALADADPLEAKEHVAEHPRPHDPAVLLRSLRKAVRDGNAAQTRADLKALVDVQVPTASLVDDDAAKTPLILTAMRLNQLRVVRVMIQQGVLQGAVDQQGQQLVHLAAQQGVVQVVAWISQVKPDLLLAESSDGMLAVHVAAAAGQVDVLKAMSGRTGVLLLAKNPLNQSTALHEAAKAGKAAAVQYLLSVPAVAQACLNAKDNKGRTPLHYAAEKGHVDVIKPLLAGGADGTVKTVQGETALDLAKEKLHAAAVELLAK